MSETEQGNACPTCGGMLSIEYTIQFREARPYMINVSSMERVCLGHPMPERKHDGQLGSNATVTYGEAATSAWGIVDGIHIEHFDLGQEDVTGMSPSQALSLLSWLKQEEPTLQKMAKEQY